MTKNYRTEVLVSITTGILLCEFSQVHECCEFLAESPLWTHQFADKLLVDKLKSAVLCQHPDLSTVNAEGIGTDNWVQFRDQVIQQFGPELELTSLPLCSKEELAESFSEPLKRNKAIVLKV